MALYAAPSNHREQKLSRSPPAHLTIRTHDLQPPLSEQTLQFSTPSPPSSPKSPPSPHSPWAFSPLRPPPPSRPPPPPPQPENQISSPYHCIASLHRQDGNLYSIVVSKGIIFTGSDSKRIRAWKQNDFIERGSIRSSSGKVETMLAYNNNLFTSHRDRKIRVWNFSASSDNFQAKKVATLPPKLNPFVRNKKPESARQQKKHKDIISCMAYYQPDGLLYTGSFDRTVKAWRVCDKKCVDAFVAHEGHVNAVVVNQDDGCVFTCSTDGTVKIWRRVYKESSHALTMTLKFQQSPINALALITSTASPFAGPPTCSLYSGSSDGTVSFWEKERFSSRFNHGGILQGHRFAVLCLLTIGRFVFSGSQDTTIRVWKRMEEGGDSDGDRCCLHQCVAVLNGHRGPVRCLSVSLDAEEVVTGFLVYSAGLDQSFKIWKVSLIPGVDKDKEKECLDLDYDVSPVLSPSWVEKKVQWRHNPFHCEWTDG